MSANAMMSALKQEAAERADRSLMMAAFAHSKRCRGTNQRAKDLRRPEAEAQCCVHEFSGTKGEVAALQKDGQVLEVFGLALMQIAWVVAACPARFMSSIIR
jgi:hypothetical protein